MNQEFWADKGTAVKQELIFASTGTKKKTDDAWKYVEAFAGSDIETNPPKTNADVQASGKTFTRHVDEMPSAEVIAEIEHKVSEEHLEETLMRGRIAEVRRPAERIAEDDRQEACRGEVTKSRKRQRRTGCLLFRPALTLSALVDALSVRR